MAFVEKKPNMTEISPDKKTEIAANMRQARHYMEKGDYVSAKKKLERVLELDEEHAEALRLLEECNGMIGQQREAERVALQDAIDAGNIKALQDFIAQYPKSEFVSQAENRIVDFTLWDDAKQRNTKTAYQHYLSTSTILGYKDDAEAAIYRIETEEAWEDCHNSNSTVKLERFLKDYPKSNYAQEAEYELDLIYADKYYKQNERSNALSYYRKAEKIHPLSDEHNKQYSELLLEEQYNKLKYSNDINTLLSFYRKLTLDSPYYNPISNRIAIVKAERLTVSSSQMDMDVALSYAQDDDTKTSVKQYISNVKKQQRENRRDMRKWKRKLWWEDRATVGWNIITAGFDPNIDIDLDSPSDFPSTCSLGSGLRLRFGRYDDIINITLGVNYQHYWGKYVTANNSGYYNDEEIHYMTIHKRLSFPINLKINIPNQNRSSFYLGCSAEFGYELDDIIKYFNSINSIDDLYYMQPEPSIAIEPQIGFNHKHFDWGVYYRYYLEGYRFMNSDYSDANKRIGLYMTVYF